MNPLLKIGLDLGPLIVFFASYYGAAPYWGENSVYIATGVFMLATFAAGGAFYALARKISPLMVFSGIVVMVFGGLTLVLKDKTFIQLKPTIYYLTVSGILLGGLAFGRLVIKEVMDIAMHLSDEGWRKLTWRVAIFFACMAGLNEFVWRTYSWDTWMLLKVWGFIPLSLAFFAAQMPLLLRYEIKPPEESSHST